MARVEMFVAATLRPVSQAVCADLACAFELPVPALSGASDLDLCR